MALVSSSPSLHLRSCGHVGRPRPGKRCIARAVPRDSQFHATVLPGPFGGLFYQYRPDEPYDGGTVRADADVVGSPVASRARRKGGGMPEVTCADCGQCIGADRYTHGITDDIYDLGQPVRRLRPHAPAARAQRCTGWAAAGVTASTAAGNSAAPGPCPTGGAQMSLSRPRAPRVTSGLRLYDPVLVLGRGGSA